MYLFCTFVNLIRSTFLAYSEIHWVNAWSPVYVQKLQNIYKLSSLWPLIILFQLPFLEYNSTLYISILKLKIASILVKQMPILCSICISEKIQWAQCEDCFKWRKLPADVCLSSRWTCSENSWDPERYNHQISTIPAWVLCLSWMLSCCENLFAASHLSSVMIWLTVVPLLLLSPCGM